MKKRNKILIISSIIISSIIGFSITIGLFYYIKSPSARSGHNMVYDTNLNRFILFGGGIQTSDSYTYLGDTWIYDPITNTWSEISFEISSLGPMARASHAMVYDPVNQVSILFGGVDQNDHWLNDIWVFDANSYTWIPKSIISRPPARGSCSAYYDITAQKMIIFGGYRQLGGYFDDTWSYDYSTNNWTNLNPIEKPLGRYGAPMVYDPVNQRGILFGGRTTAIMDDMWAYYYANNSWVELNVTNRPSNRYWEGLAYDESTQKLILFGGRYTTIGTGDALSDTWIYDLSNNTWIEVFPTSYPSSRFFFSLLYEPKSHKVILFGGFRFPESNFGDTWSYESTSNQWNKLKG